MAAATTALRTGTGRGSCQRSQPNRRHLVSDSRARHDSWKRARDDLPGSHDFFGTRASGVSLIDLWHRTGTRSSEMATSSGTVVLVTRIIYKNDAAAKSSRRRDPAAYWLATV